MERIERAGLSVAPELVAFVEQRALPGSGVTAEAFWHGAAAILAAFAPRNRALLAERARLQQAIDRWHDAHPAPDPAAQRAFLREIGYLVPEPAPFTIATADVDPEIASLAAPQLVVPILNARFLLNAANARWGSLYDALYGSDALAPVGDVPGYDAARGALVVGWVRDFLDAVVPLATGSWRDWRGDAPALADPAQLVGRAGDHWLLRHHGLHLELVVDRAHPVGRDDPAGLADVLVEAAATTICDLEDSVAAVDAADKVAAYDHMLGLMQGTLEARFDKAGEPVRRVLADDRRYVARDGGTLVLPGRALLLVRHVGLLMTTDAVVLPDGSEAPEGIVDALVATLCALHDLRGPGAGRNSRAGAIYVVKPKLHGPDEAAFTDALFDAVEALFDLPRHTVKLGLMDEERRTSANLAACLHALRHRVMFVNTGFLDRTGDEIHTAMHAGAIVPKRAIRDTPWIAAYEDRNVQIALACGMAGRAQIGKGMWAAPDRLAAMLAEKIAHPLSGATTAWVPSPTAAVLHATHYHRVDVAARQRARAAEPVASLDALLTPPLAPAAVAMDAAAIRAELENNAQGILGYVVRWVEQGVGCSKVPDRDDVALMEDRATLRISAQHLANWLHHGVASAAEVEAALRRMAAEVDRQNARDPQYRAMAGREAESLAFQAARALVFEGAAQPSGYTEPLLHRFRRAAKRAG
ncbi:malate synthase G [Sphingomonas sp. BK235]|uniref:malate synthase G n=1 Tax=Sphingomonas sp. BK235 TaxID=2512131 RepID=UPI0010EE4A63|nr:malate synthase G [Sphingomonas sp. BK235]TCP34310.1 malate synthase [Sphingomonas sp. BK235]